MRFELENIIRKNIRKLTPYSSARSEYAGDANVFLDANESSDADINADGTKGVNRYPDPMQMNLKKRIGALKEVCIENIFLGNGSDEAIDILFRAFCEPGKSNVIICPPTYGMYEISAMINDVQILNVPLTDEFELDEDGIQKSVNGETRMIFICNPNNPTGNAFQAATLRRILSSFHGVVIVDEAYIDFSDRKSMLEYLGAYPNLIVLQTLSKARAMAGLRIGMAFASREVVRIFNTIKPPYNISSVAQQAAIEALEIDRGTDERIRQVRIQREMLRLALEKFSFVEKIFKSETNFLLVRMKNAEAVHRYLIAAGIVVRNRSGVRMCENCLRITVGSGQENKKVIDTLKNYNE